MMLSRGCIDMDTNPNYIAIWPAITKTGRSFCVVLRKYDRITDDYVSTRCSRPMPRADADAEAQKWAVAEGVEIR